MNNKQKNRKKKTSKVYSLLPEYQYVTGINSLQNGGQAFGYEDFMTNQLFKAEDGTETPGMGNPNAPECPEGQHWDATVEACVVNTVEVEGDKTVDNTSNDGTDKDKENNPYNLPPWMTNTHSTAYNPYQGYNAGYPFQDEHSEAVNSMMDNSLLGGLFITANKLKGSGKAIKNAFKNINPKTGKPYQHTDFGVSTLTNTTDKNVLLNPEGLDNLYDDQGKIIDENNTADKLFINQNEARSNYFNQIADYHSNTFVDDQGNSRMSKQTMDADGNITYADIEEEVDVVNPNFNSELPEGPDNPMYIKEKQTRTHTDADLTAGDLAQDHIKDINVSRIQYNEDGSVKSMTRNNDEGKNVTVPYDKDADYKEGTNIEIINRQEEINRNRGNVGGSCASMNMCDDPNNPGECISCDEAQYGYELPKAQYGVNNINAFRLNKPVWDLSGRCYNDGCAKRYYDSPHDLSIGIGTGIGKKGEDYMGDATLWGGYSFNPQPGSGSFRGAQEGLAGYLGANIGGRMIMPQEVIEDNVGDANFEQFANAVGTIGYKGEWKPNNDYTAFLTGRDKNPLQYGLGAFYKHPLMGGSSEVGGYANLGNLNFTAGYVPGTGMNYGVGLGIPIRKKGGDLRRFVYAQDDGGQLAYFQNGGAPQPSGKTYKIDGRIVSKEEYDNFIANGGTNATVDDENPNPINTVPVHNTDGSVDNVPLIDNTTPIANPSDNQTVNDGMVDADGDGLSDFIDIDGGGGTNQPVDGVTPYTPPGPEAPVSFSYTDKPELTEEMMENMTDEQIEQYNKYRGKEEKWNKLKADYKTSGLGRIENAFSTGVHKLMPAVDYINQVGTAAQLAVDEANVANANDEYSDFNTAIEASRSDKGDFDVNTGVYRANTLGYGDGPRGQIAQMGAETGSKPAPDYTYLKQFLDASIVSYDPSFLMTQARDGEEIDADMELVKQLMAAGADFEII